MNTLYVDLILISIGLIGLILLVLPFFKTNHTDTLFELTMKQLERDKQEHIKWQVNRNLAARKRKDAISDLIAMFGNRDIKIDYESDSFYVIIKINKDALIEREVK